MNIQQLCVLDRAQNPKDKEVTFSIHNLPPEIRQMIYTLYLHGRPPFLITQHTGTMELIHSTPLTISSPAFLLDVPTSFHHRNRIFEFSSGDAMLAFSAVGERKIEVRRVKVVYGVDEEKTRDWIFLVMSCFEKVEEVTFVLGKEPMSMDQGRCMELEQRKIWWDAVTEAIREGLRGDKRSVWVRGGHKESVWAEERVTA